MPLQKLQFRPGVNREGTDYANEGGWYDCNHVRFRSGFPEKIGGWAQLSPVQFLGLARSLWNWVSISGNTFIGVGTNLKYYIYQGGAYNDITPIYYPASGTDTLTNPYATVSGSKTVTVTDPNYVPNVGDYVILSGGTAVGGITVSGEYVIVSVNPTSNKYTILTTTTATSTTTGGGTVTAQYEYPSGTAIYTSVAGWGSGPWGGVLVPITVTLGTNPFASTNGSSTITVTQTAHGLTTGQYVYFKGATGFANITAAMLNNTFIITGTTTNTYTIVLPSSYLATATTSGGGSAVIVTEQSGTRGWSTPGPTSIGTQLRLWSNDNFGQDLIIAPRGGPIFYWQEANGVSTRAILLSTLATTAGFTGSAIPTTVNQIISSEVQQFVIAFGAQPYPLTGAANFNPMTVRWSDQANPYQWVPAVTNQSGDYTLTNGSYIMGARATRQEILVWTDSAIYSMQYVGAPYVWGFQLLMDNTSIISPNAMVTINNVTYWMGTDKFYMYTGTVAPLPCSLRQYIFQNLNQQQAFQVFAGANEGFSEIWWFYCSANSTAVDSYVIYNYLDNVWTYGTMGRTAWLQTGLQQYPIAADYNNRLLNHELGTDDNSTSATAPIDAYIQSSDFDIGEGNNFVFVWRILPDINFNGSSTASPYVTMTVKPRQNSGAPYGTADTPQVVSANNYSNSSEYVVQQFTGQVYTRLRGRQMSFRIESNSIGTAWQLGVPRIDGRLDGRR